MKRSFVRSLWFAALLALVLPGVFRNATTVAPLAPPPRSAEEFEEDAEKKFDWFMYQRTYPNGALPEEARRKAWQQRLRVAAQPAVAQTWVPLGPQPTNSFYTNNWFSNSGRINAIAVSPDNPDLILIGAATGGIWRSTDGGANFAPVSDNQVDLAVGSIAFAPSNPAIVYAGMGDSKSSYVGSGVLKSTDSGASWTRVSNNTLPTPGAVVKLVVNPSDPNQLYLAQYHALSGSTLVSSGFYLSTDGGVNWRRTLAGLPRDLVKHPTDDQTLYLAMNRVDQGGLAPGLYRSTDAGQTWTILYPSPYSPTTDIRVAVTPSSPQTIYVYVGGRINNVFSVRVEVSNDGGGTFINRGANGVDSGQFGYNTYLFVSPTEANTIYLGSRDVHKSTDGGMTFVNLNNSFTAAGAFTPFASNMHPDQHSLAFLPGDANTIFVGNDGGLHKSTNGGASFTGLNNSLSLSQFISIALHPTDGTRTYGGTQDNGSQKRLTTGTPGAWRDFTASDGGRVVIDPLNPSRVFPTWFQCAVLRYLNNGDTPNGQVARNATFGEPATGPRVAFYPPFVGNGVDSTLYFGTWRLFISTDLGATWMPPGGTFDQTVGGTDVLSAIAVARANLSVIYTGSRNGRAMVSVNNGADWTNITAGLPTRSITSITVHPNDAMTAYLTVSGFGTGHVFKTTNGGAAWTDVSGNLPNIPANAFLFDPLTPNTVYVGTDIGVFRSESGGTTWASFNNGLPPVIVTAFAAQATGRIQIATYGRGIYDLANPVTSVSAASFAREALAPESIVAAFGIGLATRLETATTQPLPTQLAGTTLRVRDSAGVERLAPLFFTAPQQVNYLLPAGLASGTAQLTLSSGDSALSLGTVNVAQVAPGLFTANANGQGVAAAVALRVRADGSQTLEPVAQFDAALGRFVPLSLALGPESDQLFLILFGTGLRFNDGLSNVLASLGGVNAEVFYAGAQGDFVGLDQVNLRIPRSLAGRGEIDVALVVSNKTANLVRINIR
jgi:uncharacterized protein (TIGR03437 family)